LVSKETVARRGREGNYREGMRGEQRQPKERGIDAGTE